MGLSVRFSGVTAWVLALLFLSVKGKYIQHRIAVDTFVLSDFRRKFVERGVVGAGKLTFDDCRKGLR